MAEGNQNDNQGQQGQESGREFREKFERLLAENKELKRNQLFFDAGLGHLSDRRRRMLMNSFDEKEKDKLTKDMLYEAAKEEGWHEPPKAEGSDDGQGQDNSAGDGAGQNGQQSGNQRDPAIDNEITGLTDIELAHIMGLRSQNGGGNSNLLDALSSLPDTASKDEVLAAIRQAGPNSGVMLSDDVD